MKVPPLNFRREDIPDLSTGANTDKLLRGLNGFGAEAERLINGGLTFAANIKSFEKDVTIRMQDQWFAPAMLNSWANVGGYESVAYTKHDGRVWLRGTLTGGASGSVAFYLPASYRPSAVVGCPGASAGGASALGIGADGAVTAYGTTFSIDGASFWAADPSPVPNAAFPVSVRNETPGSPAPKHVWATRAVDLTNDRENPVAVGGVAWVVSRDQIVIRDVGNLFPGRRYRVTILVVAE